MKIIYSIFFLMICNIYVVGQNTLPDTSTDQGQELEAYDFEISYNSRLMIRAVYPTAMRGISFRYKNHELEGGVFFLRTPFLWLINTKRALIPGFYSSYAYVFNKQDKNKRFSFSLRLLFANVRYTTGTGIEERYSVPDCFPEPECSHRHYRFKENISYGLFEVDYRIYKDIAFLNLSVGGSINFHTREFLLLSGKSGQVENSIYPNFAFSCGIKFKFLKL